MQIMHTYATPTFIIFLLLTYARAGRYWNLLSRYIMAKSITVLLYITYILLFSQPEANYTIECIILVDT